MKIILVDDEALGLHHMERLLGNYEEINIIGTYQNPYQALDVILRERPDVVFLDIEMPGLSGMELAERIQNDSTEIGIVFVTAYDEYAIKAFEINAVDYIVKPVQRTRLEKTINRIYSNAQIELTSYQSPSMVCCFRALHFKRLQGDSNSIEVNWRTSKARELFCYLILHRQRSVRKDIILDLLWPGIDDKKGYAQLYATVYQIRKTLESININITITNLEQSYILELNDVKLDMEVWEDAMGDLPIGLDNQIHRYQNIMELYQGDYFGEEGYLWAESERERLRILWLHYIHNLAEHYITKKMYTEAILLFKQVQELYSFVDSSYFMLMKIYALIGEHRAVEQEYVRLTKVLREEYDITPDQNITDWYENWKLIRNLKVDNLSKINGV